LKEPSTCVGYIDGKNSFRIQLLFHNFDTRKGIILYAERISYTRRDNFVQ